MNKQPETDLTVITNEQNCRLLDRFQVLIKDTRFFDVLVGYFYPSGFYELFKLRFSLKCTVPELIDVVQ